MRRALDTAARNAFARALAACANRNDKADPDAVAAYLLVHCHVPEVRACALKLATAWAAKGLP